MNFKWSLICALCTLFSFPIISQTNLWKDIDDVATRNSGGERWIIPNKYRSLELEVDAFSEILQNAPARFNAAGDEMVVSLPFPDGSFQDFAIQMAPIMEAKLADKNPDIKTFSGQGIDDPSLAVYLDITPAGFHGMVIGPGQSFFIDPYFKNERTKYVCYEKRHFSSDESLGFSCGYEPGGNELPAGDLTPISNRNAATTLRTYRIAIAATAEYTAYHGSAANALAAINTTLNRVRGIFETELSISLTLVGNNSSIIYTDAATDPYSDTPTLAENQTNIDATIGNANYDIGHLVDHSATGSGGVAGLGVVCWPGNKARGLTAHTSPNGDPYDVDYVAHEIGHQFSANHTFNGNVGSCGGGNRNASTAYEPNSGSTIMAYTGICGSQNVQRRSESHFHLSSIQEITDFVVNSFGGTCPTTSATGNSGPSVNANAENVDGKHIPVDTPFELTASGSDPDGHSIYYCWEQWDLGTEGTSTSASDGPIFRSYHPTHDATRVFPRLSSILDNSTSMGEYLPSITRDLTFKCTARDGQSSGGGYAADEITLHVTNANSISKFEITSHGASAQHEGNVTVTWDVGNTTSAPVSCANVDILLSTDGGHAFSTLVTNTANDGSESITLPNNATGQARIKVKCSDNVFFDINNADLRIAPSDASCAENITNGDFAAGNTGWTESNPNSLIGYFGAGYEGYSQNNTAWLGYFPNSTTSISQTVSIPASPHFANLSFWYKYLRFDCGGDEFRVKVNGSVVEHISLCNNDAAMSWKRALIDLSAYAGTSPTISFEVILDGTHASDVFIGDISIYTCTGGAFAPLPVELTDFQAVEKNGGALLNWDTQSETDNFGFEIEHQKPSGEFRKIGFMEGAGTSLEPKSYQYYVPELSSGTHYFRLRQMDTDGSFSYSPVRALKLNEEHHVNVFPNPVSEFVFFEMTLSKESEITLEVINTSGQLMNKVTEGRYAEGQFKFSMNVDELPSGVYFYRLRGEGFEENGKFLVE